MGWFLTVLVVAGFCAWLAARARRGQSHGHSSFPGRCRARWSKLASPILTVFGWRPSLNSISWSMIEAILQCRVTAIKGVTRLRADFNVGLAPEDAQRLGGYLDVIGEDVADSVKAIADQQGWTVSNNLRVQVSVDDSAWPLKPNVLPANALARSGARDMNRTAAFPVDRAGPGGWPPLKLDYHSAVAAKSASPATRPTNAGDSDATSCDTAILNYPWLSDISSGTRWDLAEVDNVIGRSRSCTIRIDADRRVSRRHAIVSIEGDLATVYDVGSSNGTKLNDADLVARSLLTNGDILEVGSTLLEFHEASAKRT